MKGYRVSRISGSGVVVESASYVHISLDQRIQRSWKIKPEYRSIQTVQKVQTKGPPHNF